MDYLSLLIIFSVGFSLTQHWQAMEDSVVINPLLIRVNPRRLPDSFL